MLSFTDNVAFPTFYTLPTTSTTSSPAPVTDTDNSEQEWYLLAQIKNNMTITKPTLIVTDHSGMDFAVIFEDTTFNLKERGLKKGNTMVVPQARRTEKGPGRKDVLVVEKGECQYVKMIPGKLDRILELGVAFESIDKAGKCDACGKESELMKCTGCGIVAYCSKDCQAKAWSERGHKTNCKTFRTMKDIWR
ncbi:hypothetical protein BJ170DRAFT_609404 [Xylariales sp. AK1849]|nr:hypothetical protein BJ170DRAFT_609404 [Xylariales sp. AK1849]